MIGVSGSGKSSLLNVLSGYRNRDVQGTIRINGINNQGIIRRNSCYVMQEYAFHQFISVRESLMFRINCKANASKEDEREKNEKVCMSIVHNKQTNSTHFSQVH